MLVSYEGSDLAPLHVLPNAPMDGLFSNVESACKRGLPEIKSEPAHKVPALIVGGGPSLGSTLEIIKQLKSEGAQVFALNNAARFLWESGIIPDAQIIIDARAQNTVFVQTRWASKLYLSSQCHPDLFDAALASGNDVTIWHPVIKDIEKHIGQENPLLIGGGLTVGLSGMCLVYTLGYRELHLFGFDSCHAEGKSHAYEQAMNKGDEITEVTVAGRTFKCSVAMAAQAYSFQKVAEMLANLDCGVYVHGDGLIPHIARQMTREEKILTAVYDLMVSPPTFDFVSFLSEAERARTEGGFDRIDVVFQPGPMKGFRSDPLPPDVPAREGMLHRVCVSLCRLLPSVRNVMVLKERSLIQGEVFPVDYHVETNPKSHYGAWCFKQARPVFKATESAKRMVSHLGRYATITIRQSSYWPTRNSKVDAWLEVADWLMDRGITPIFVPDAEKANQYFGGHMTSEIAALDIDVRLALYEGAEVNLGVNNGPMALLYWSDAPYIVFKILSPDAYTASKQFLEKQGVNEGDQFSKNGKTIWKDDDADTVIAALKEFLPAQLHEAIDACV